jgi:hypothetical protein
MVTAAPALDAATPADAASTSRKGKEKAAPPAREFSATKYAETHGIWWFAQKNQFWKRGTGGEWMRLTEGNLRQELEADGLRSGTLADPTGEVEKVLIITRNQRQLDGVMELAGHFAGVEMIGRNRVLVPRGPRFLTPRKGDWPLIAKLMENLFCLPVDGPEQPVSWQIPVKKKARDHALEAAVWKLLCHEMDIDGAVQWVFDQRLVVYVWLRLTLEIFRRREPRPGHAPEYTARRNGQALAMAGPKDGGKSLLFSFILTPLLGGRMANAAKFLTGQTQFNGNLFGSELLILSDTPLSQKMDDRNALGDGIRMVVGEQWHAWEGKGKDAMDQLDPIWRLVIAMNDDANNLRTLPPFNVEGVPDKITLLHTCSRDMPVRTTTTQEYMDFGEALVAELPAFLHYLEHELVIPDCLTGGRFGMITVHAPDLMQELFEESETGRLLELLSLARWVPDEATGHRYDLWRYVHRMHSGGSVKYGEVKMVSAGGEMVPAWWEGSAVDLKHLLTADGKKDTECTLHREASDLFKFHRPERLLARLAKEEPLRVEPHRTKSARLWRIGPPPSAA